MPSTPSPAIELFSSEPTGLDTFVVLGAARGGTSMVAGLLRMIGVPMGEEIDPGNNEDRDFLAHGGRVDLFQDSARAKERKAYILMLQALIRKRNQDYDSWGWKDPATSFYLGELKETLRRPRFLMVTRDPGAVAGRRIQDRPNNTTNADRRGMDDLRAVLDQYSSTIELLARLRRPTLLISYERSLRHPEALLGSISRFTGLEIPHDETNRKKLRHYIMPDRITGDISVFLPPNDSNVDRDRGPRSEIEDQLASSNAEHAVRRAMMGEAAARIEAAQSFDPSLLASALTEAMGADRADEAEVLAFRLLAVLAASDPRLLLHPRALTAALSEPGGVPAPQTASLPLFNLGMLALAAGDASQAYWSFTSARLLIEKAFGAPDVPFLAPWWALLFNQAVAARLCGDEVDARTNCTRILHAATLGLPIDSFALKRDPKEYDLYRPLAEIQLDEMSKSRD